MSEHIINTASMDIDRHEDGFIVSNFEGELMPNYCPKCGKKLV